MASSALIVLDEQDMSIVYEGDWSSSTKDPENPWFNLSASKPSMTGAIPRPNMTVTFEGKDHQKIPYLELLLLTQVDHPLGVGLSLVGIGDPSDLDGRNLSITLDPLTPESTRLSSPPISNIYGYYREWFKTPVLNDGIHTVHFNICEWAELDLALVKVGPNTSLLGRTIFVDDNDSQVEYWGVGWNQNASMINAGYPQFSDPMLNTSHQTSSPGDMITFRFYGTSVSVWGIFHWDQLSNIVASYSLDEVLEERSYPVNATMVNDHMGFGALHFPFYSAKNLAPALHVLTINVTIIQNATFRFDYITYEPAFSNLLSMPYIPPGPLSPTTHSSSVPTASLVPGQVVMRKPALTVVIVGSFIAGFILISLSIIIVTHLRVKVRAKSQPQSNIGRITAFHVEPRDADSGTRSMTQSASLSDARSNDNIQAPLPPSYENLSDVQPENPSPELLGNLNLSPPEVQTPITAPTKL